MVASEKSISNFPSDHQLPRDVWSLILALLDKAGDRLSAKLVCRRWYELVWETTRSRIYLSIWEKTMAPNDLSGSEPTRKKYTLRKKNHPITVQKVVLQYIERVFNHLFFFFFS